MSALPDDDGIPFSFFVELVDAIADIRPHKVSEKQSRTTRYVETPAYKTFRRWVERFRERYSPLPPDTTAIVFRLLFPDEDVKRKYGLQETRLAQHLVKILGVSSATQCRGERLRNWQQEDTMGCLGDEVKDVMLGTAHSQASTVAVTIAQVDALLTELAAKSAYSHSAVHASFSATNSPRRSREAILTTLYHSLSPNECAVVTQIILKDLRPILYPIPRSANHPTIALLHYNSTAVTPLSKESAMRAWDPSGRMSVIFRSRANIEDAAQTYERLKPGDAMPDPVCGTPIQVRIPKCSKGLGCVQALKLLRGADKVWVETKYDGERAQIHLRLDEAGDPHIKIYSKSGRESTLDRAGIHDIVCDALGISRQPSTGDGQADEPSLKQDIVVEAEMVAFSETTNRIDEFWRIRSLIASTAIGVRHKTPPPAPSTAEGMDSQCSMISNGSDGGTRHLALVFFDILLLDGTSLLSFPYSERRAVLERVIRTTPGYSMLAERTCIDMKHGDPADALRKTFATLVADYQEGAVLKADGAQYGEWRLPWVKLKRDYIDGYGDTVDLVLLGAAWDKDRARELRVSPTVYTTFYFGLLANADDCKSNPSSRPLFEVVFTSAYGLSRQQLEQVNFMIKSMDAVPYSARVCKDVIEQLPYAFNLCPNLPQPAVLLQKPLLAELFGAGFSKAQGSMFYELRFPRVSKVHRPSERPWSDGITLQEYQQIARAAVGRDRPGKAEDDWAKTIFRPDEPASPGVRCPKKRKQTEMFWIEKLEVADGKTRSGGSPSKRARPDTAATRRKANGVGNTENIANGGEGMIDENAPDTGTESLRSRLGLACLTSVTNVAVAAAVSSPIQHLSGTSVDVLPRVYPSSTTPVRDLPKSMDKTLRRASLGQAPPPVATPGVPLPQTPPLTTMKPARQGPQPTLILKAEDVEGRLDLGAPLASPVTLHRFLQDSVVWLARPHGTARPLWRAPSHSVVPTGNHVNTLDAVMIACGWDSTPPCGWAKRGVIFVDVSEQAQGFLKNTLNELASRRAALLERKMTARCKPILILNMKMLAYDALDETLTADEVEARAICRFG
ncbi:hypothetical protein L226DRAFT_545021 [Lentinus tigrinus ALCF2SS1-7]|uniref:ATP-dependent DNA ligase family profile domain-containing protein n=1 Tax=Lentinus tigrinus ALCF2SS1-6 TaxID=1328759 RepID=A0A5C2SLF1_9APHY|nr:hypothetical protein L227DRAFT_584179 [Lentinus tigrinus ALCF2SS1-6]RPD76683.1 hypothetical protein L226DRAFT_545021 [Lentinus tigrinus ALCF2SS1-7]